MKKTGEVRLKATEAMYGKTKRDKMIENTTNMIVCLSEITAMQAMNLIKLQELLESKFEIIKSGSGHTSHDTQNN